MESEIRVTMHNGRRSRKDGAAYCAKHNSRTAGVGAHVDRSRTCKNIYLTFDVDGTIKEYAGDEKVDFDAHEAKVYEALFSDSLKAQNDRYRAKGHKAKIKTMKQYRESSPVEEIIFQIGSREDSIPEYVVLDAVKQWVAYMAERYPLIKVLDISYHGDEGQEQGHVHVRQVYCAQGKDALEVSERKCLQQMGIERPDMSKEQSRYNHPKQTLTADARAAWIRCVDGLNLGVRIIETPKEPRKESLTKEEYIHKKITEDVQLLTRRKDELLAEDEKLAVMIGEKEEHRRQLDSTQEVLEKRVTALRKEESRLRTAIRNLKRIIAPLKEWFIKMANYPTTPGRSLLDDVLLDARSAGCIDSLKELER